MKFITLTVLPSLTFFALAMPIIERDAPVLTKQSYSEFQVSSGVGGKALEEVQAKFPINENNLAGVDPSDLAIIAEAARTAEQAEVGTNGFNDAIAAAGGKDTTAGKALQVGKIKNKVLKLKTDVLRIQIEVAQGNNDSAASLPQQLKKLNTNVDLDRKAAGQTSSPASNFEGTD